MTASKRGNPGLVRGVPSAKHATMTLFAILLTLGAVGAVLSVAVEYVGE
jgi:hypothetical protein